MNRLLIVIPAYNEAENIERVVDNLKNNYLQYDYVVINDGSKDDTARICKKNGYNLIDLPINLGLAGAFQAGMKYAYKHNYDYVTQLDGDGQHNPEYIVDMVEKAERENLDVIIGSRFVERKRPHSLRMVGNNLLNICIYLTTGKRISDPTSGMRLFNKKMIEKFATQMNYGPEPDTIAFLLRCKAKVGECQVVMNDRIAGESYLNLANGIKYMFHMCASILVVQWFRKKV
ncbi:glycosyltransferase family 2 protein [uncultured Clostridium sp.]|uniref:glycosyltransferase family 2 protein n=1 Tax=uncultured Clostridium sp. TaxID=59620 RepID=UPI0026010A9D|nr:glycosyltransferase family 2 protein [uncultured Clostridium sp.]